MERVESAFKSSIRKEMTPPVVYDEFLAVATTTTVGSSQNGGFEDFSVDDLLDLSNDDVFVEEEETEPKTEQQQQEQEEMVHVSSDDTLRRSNDFSGCEEFGSELSVPADDLASLEWLSHFVEDSFSIPNLTGAPIEKPAWLTGDRKHPVNPVTCFKSPVPAKARSKRNRNGVKFWSSSSSSSSTSSSSSSGPSSPWFTGAELIEKPPVPKKHKKKSVDSVFGGFAVQQPPQRRCSHCGVQKTPQWRAGPMGAKTLCNACGVRFKSGRLLPEYRPACSPTFSSELHSNHHRKVMEMRRKKEPTDEMVQSPQAVPSF